MIRVILLFPLTIWALHQTAELLHAPGNSAVVVPLLQVDWAVLYCLLLSEIGYGVITVIKETIQ